MAIKYKVEWFNDIYCYDREKSRIELEKFINERCVNGWTLITSTSFSKDGHYDNVYLILGRDE